MKWAIQDRRTQRVALQIARIADNAQTAESRNKKASHEEQKRREKGGSCADNCPRWKAARRPKPPARFGCGTGIIAAKRDEKKGNGRKGESNVVRENKRGNTPHRGAAKFTRPATSMLVPQSASRTTTSTRGADVGAL